MMNVKIKKVLLRAISTAFLLVYLPTLQAESFQFSGYFKSYLLAQDKITIEQASVANNNPHNSALKESKQSQNALRLMAAYLSENSNVEIHYEVQPLYFSNANVLNAQAGIAATVSVGANQYRYHDINPILHQVNDNTIIIQNLDRLNYQYSNDHGDLTIGRQVLSFGSARFINPTDIFIPFNIKTLNQEYRVGIDAIRYQAALGDFSTLDTGIIIGKDGKKENSAAFIRTENSINGNDLEAMFIYLDDAWLIGGGIERAIGDFGFWFEAAYMNWQKPKQANTAISANPKDSLSNNWAEISMVPEDYWRSSIGFDYSITQDIIFMFEYHYNGAGTSNVENYPEQYAKKPYQKAGVFLLGQHYAIPAVTWLASPLVSISTSAFYNLDDNSLFITLNSETSWSDNLYSDFGAYLSAGDNFVYQQDTQAVTFGSEFGGSPLSIYASLRYYF